MTSLPNPMPTNGERLQQNFLNACRKHGTRVLVVLVSGERLQGIVKSFDAYAITLNRPEPCMFLKTSIAIIEPVLRATLRKTRARRPGDLQKSGAANVPLIQLKRHRLPRST